LLNLIEKIAIDSRLKAISLTAITALFTRGINAIVVFISVPLMLNYLGEERYGVLITIISLLGIISFADLGLGMGLQNRIPNLEKEENKEELLRLVSGTFFLLLSIAIALLLFFLLIHSFISWDDFFGIKNKEIPSESRQSVVAFFIVFIIGIPFSMVQRVQDGFQQGYINQIWYALGSILGIVLLYVAIKLEKPMPYLIVAVYGANTFLIICNFLYQFFKVRPTLLPRFSKVEFADFRVLLYGGLSFFFLQLTNILFQSSDNIIIAKSLGAADVTTFSIGYRLVSLMILPVQVTIPALLPALNDAFAKKDTAWAKKIIKKNILIIFVISIAMSIVLMVFADNITHVWINATFVLPFEFKLALAFFIFLMNYNYLFSFIGLTSDLVKTTTFFYPLAVLISIIIKIITVSMFGISAVLWVVILCFPILFFLPILLKLKSNQLI
jgi:O-antigen/teichoic acid export membrane protein